MYSLIMILAVLSAVLAGYWTRPPLPLSTAERCTLGGAAFCGAMLGAKLPFALSDWEGFVSGTAWFANGKTILCGLVGGYFAVELAKWALNIRVKTGDSFAVSVPVGVGIGRLACFQAGCCYGTPTRLPWGVVFAHIDGQPRHPTQLYESAFHLTAAVALAWLLKRGRFRGQLIKLYILSYVLYRFVTEWIRPEARGIGNLTAYQWSCLAIGGLFLWLWRRDAAQLRLAPR